MNPIYTSDILYFKPSSETGLGCDNYITEDGTITLCAAGIRSLYFLQAARAIQVTLHRAEPGALAHLDRTDDPGDGVEVEFSASDLDFPVTFFNTVPPWNLAAGETLEPALWEIVRSMWRLRGRLPRMWAKVWLIS